MRARVNDFLRKAIGRCVVTGGLLLSCVHRRRIRKFKARLRPDRSTDGRYALTSGSAGDPKRILYTSRRLRMLKFVFSDMFARACSAFHIKRTSLYVFSSFEPDESLTSLLLEEIESAELLVYASGALSSGASPGHPRTRSGVRRDRSALVAADDRESRRALRHEPLDDLDLL